MAYKAFNPDFTCKGKQYEENTTYEENGNEICEAGVMHYCENPFDVLDYYPLVNDNGEISQFAEVEPLGKVFAKGNKSATNKLHIKAKLGLKGFIKACIDFTLEKTKIEEIEDDIENDNGNNSAQIGSSGYSAKIGSSGDFAQIGSSGYSAQIGSSGYSAQIGSSGDFAQIGSSGDSAQIGSSGYSAKIGSSGDFAQIGSSGYFAQIGSSGDSAQIGSSGYSAKIGSSGYSAQIGSSGDFAQIGSSGDSAQIGSSGYSAKIGSSGDFAKIGSSGDFAKIGSSGYSAQIGSSGYSAQITSKGKHSVVMAAGYNSIAKAKIGSWITLAEWIRTDETDDSDNYIWIPRCVKTEYVDGERIKEDTFYKLVDGEFKEVEEN
jgi:hypothetical protein